MKLEPAGTAAHIHAPDVKAKHQPRLKTPTDAA